jgi:hypothetical protein
LIIVTLDGSSRIVGVTYTALQNQFLFNPVVVVDDDDDDDDDGGGGSI